MAAYLRQVLGFWQSDDESMVDQIQFIPVMVFVCGFMFCLTLLFTGFAFDELSSAWLTGNWHSFWIMAGSPIRFYWYFPIITAYSSRATARATQPPRSQRVRELRQAVLDGDETRAPLDGKQPIAFAEGELPAAVEIVPRLRPPVSTTPTGLRAAGIGALAFGAIFGICTAWLLTAYWDEIWTAFGVGDGYDLYSAVASVSLAAILIAWFVFVTALLAFGRILVRRAPSRRIDPSVDPWEVKWISPTRPLEALRIAWEDARAFYQISYRSEADYVRHTIYFLDTGATLLAWEISSTNGAELLAANEHFLRIIVTYTGLPLRDLSIAAQELGKSLAIPPKMTVAERTAAIQAAREARRNRQGSRPPSRSWAGYALIAGIVAVVVLSLTPIIAGWRLQSMQRGYYNAIATRALAHQPLFTDALAQPDGHWLVKAPDGAHDPSYTYQGGAYQITGGPANYTVDATLSTSHGDPATFGDAAIEVTARQAGTSDYDGVGLMLRDVEAGPNQSVVAFLVRPDGGWRLERYFSTESTPDDWRELASSSDDSSRSSPVRKGLGASNTLLVVMRGDEMICFVNGQFVTAARDSGIPASGGAGVFLDDSASTGIFSDFAVYPAA